MITQQIPLYPSPTPLSLLRYTPPSSILVPTISHLNVIAIKEYPTMKFATCNEYFENWAIEDVFNYAADLGYDGVEIAPFVLAPSVEDISAARRDKIRAAAECF